MSEDAFRDRGSDVSSASDDAFECKANAPALPTFELHCFSTLMKSLAGAWHYREKRKTVEV